MAENIGFYGVIIYKEFKSSDYTGNLFKKSKNIIRNLFFEFGISELIDTFLIRPFFLYLMPTLLGNFSLGILVGKLMADVSFYFVAIIFYELRKKYLKN